MLSLQKVLYYIWGSLSTRCLSQVFAYLLELWISSRSINVKEYDVYGEDVIQYICMDEKMWGTKTIGGSEIWDTDPIFLGEQVTWRDKLKLIFYPKKWMLYRCIRRLKEQKIKKLRVLDVGCGTGATLIDLKKMLGKNAEVIGVEVVKLQVELANDKIKKNGVWAEALWYDGEHLPFPDASFDAIYTSDVLGHVKDVRQWLSELNRVLRPGGTLAMFVESKLGKHAWLRKYLFKRGLNIDPHQQFHVSLYGKKILKEFLDAAGFEIRKMYSIAWAKFLIHPDEFYLALQSQKGFPILRFLNKILYKIKKRFHPYSTALGELYCLLEMLIVGRWVEVQGYIILGQKR